ncbi:hypothetical protein GCM10028816_42270 [Spirosoma lituiforme]
MQLSYKMIMSIGNVMLSRYVFANWLLYSTPGGDNDPLNEKYPTTRPGIFTMSDQTINQLIPA